MSDPAKSAAEIEDVLASIRRLVADSGAASGPAGRTRPDPDRDEPEKLVLTPALRVTEPDDPWAPVPPPDPAGQGTGDAARADADAVGDDPEDEADDAGDRTWGLEDRLADWGEIEASAEEAVADAIAESLIESGAAPQRPLAPSDDTPAAEAAEFEPETGDTDWPDSGADSALRHLAMARGKAAPARSVVAPEGDGDDDRDTDGGASGAAEATGDGMDPDAAPGAETTETTEAPGPQAEEEDDMTDSAGFEPENETAAGGMEPASATTRFRPVFSRRVEPQAPSEGRREARSGSGTEDDDHDEVEDLGEDPTPFTFPDSDEGLLDEETLREIVADVVRQELQGALGQRITRNVRKMVRREIRIALAAEDLE